MPSILLKAKMIAPCGMNCSICKGHLRKTNRCPGCFAIDKRDVPTRVRCVLRRCAKRQTRFCFDCATFPCRRLEQLDKRYRTRYGMSEIENLQFIRDRGIRAFLKREQRRWISAEGILCVHDGKRYLAPLARAARLGRRCAARAK